MRVVTKSDQWAEAPIVFRAGVRRPTLGCVGREVVG